MCSVEIISYALVGAVIIILVGIIIWRYCAYKEWQRKNEEELEMAFQMHLMNLIQMQNQNQMNMVRSVAYSNQIINDNFEKSISKLPYIREVSAKIELPNKLKIEYEERQPFALIKYLESFLVMDKYGYILEISRENKFSDLPIIYNVEFENYEIGKKLSDNAKTKYDNIVYILENAKQNNFEYSISEINYESISNVKMWVAEEDIEIIYGEIDRNVISDKLKYISI